MVPVQQMVMNLKLNGINLLVMKINKIYIVLAFLGVALSLGACSDELDEFGSYKKNVGDEIVFSGRAGFEVDKNSAKAATTRTIYAESTYTENGKTYERVNWVKGDQVRVYCPEASMMKTADYAVTADNEGVVDTQNKYHSTDLVRVGDASLQWGSNGEHNFYAVYPSPQQYVGNGVTAGDVLNGSTVLKGIIPATQVHVNKDNVNGEWVAAGTYNNNDFKEVNKNNTYMKDALEGMSDKHYVLQPDMKYAYMVANTKVATPDKMGDVFLEFMPIATAVEITLRNLAWKEDVSTGQTFNLTNIVISSESGKILSGCFTADLSTMGDVVYDSNGNGKATGYPTDVQLDESVAKSSTVSIPMYANGTNGKPLPLLFGDAVTFTVFVLPTADIEDLNITINGLQGSRTGTLTGIKVEKHKKTYLNRVPITGEVLPFDFSNWLRWIDDDVLLRSLSIPGSGGSATFGLTQNGTVDGVTVTADMVRQQNYDIRKQWNAGIRCFEFAVDLNGTSESNSLGDSKIVCSGLEVGMTLEAAVDSVQALLLENYHEFAMVIVTYDTKDGWYTKSSGNYVSTRNPALFMKQLKNFWESVEKDGDWADTNAELEAKGSPITTGTVLYEPKNVTVGNARGKLFCIARPTSLNIDYGDYVLEDPMLHVSSVEADGQYKYTGLNKSTEGQALLKRGGMKKTVEMPALENHDHILIIHGWGTDKDKWGQRGFSRYPVRRTKCNDQSLWDDFSFTSYRYSLEWLHTVTTLPAGTQVTVDGTAYTLDVAKDGRIGRPFDTSKFYRYNDGYNNTLTYNVYYTYYGNSAIADHYAYEVADLDDYVNFKYETSTGDVAWVQEWARVSPEDGLFQFKSNGSDDIVYQVYWKGSYDEKFARVTKTLEYAQNKTMGDIVYINSLCGYFITDKYVQSIQPCSNTDASVFHMWGGQIATPSSTSTTSGMGGDIETYAKKINNEFYAYLLGIDTSYEAGSMGIVLIDRVGDGDGGTNIPGVIIANNFQFDLDASTNPTLSLYDEENEEAQFAPVTRSAGEEKELKITWK